MYNKQATPADATFGATITQRDKLILVGLYLSKFDQLGLRRLGFYSFLEAYNIIGLALGSRSASIKNYRDEFDPIFPNGRKGWHKRTIRDYCVAVLDMYKHLDLEAFTSLVNSFFRTDEAERFLLLKDRDQEDESKSSFAQRLLTGLAAEHYFERVRPDIPQFKDYLLENTTRLGCGYDFKLRGPSQSQDFLAVEVKGLREQNGTLQMTTKEYDVASILADRFFLFVVRNFRESPTHVIYQNPLLGSLQFRKSERVVIQTSWLTSI